MSLVFMLYKFLFTLLIKILLNDQFYFDFIPLLARYKESFKNIYTCIIDYVVSQCNAFYRKTLFFDDFVVPIENI